MRSFGQTSRRPLQQAARSPAPGSRKIATSTPGHPARHEPPCAPDPAVAGTENHSNNQIRKALARTLKSPEFQSAPQLRAFLEFVVQATLNNQQEKVKGYTIAVEALGRPEEFNPVTDPIVRVEAARLRRRLDKYYGGSGKSDPLRIRIPKGSYAPTFFAVPGSEAAGTSAKPEQPDIPEPESAGDRPGGLSTTSSPPPPGQCPSQGARQGARPGARPGARQGDNRRAANLPVYLRTGSAHMDTVCKHLLRSQISLPTALAVGVGCFFAGFLAATL